MTELPKKPYFTPKEVAVFYAINVKTLYGKINQGEIPAYKIGHGKTIRLKREDVLLMAQPVVS